MGKRELSNVHTNICMFMPRVQKKKDPTTCKYFTYGERLYECA